MSEISNKTLAILLVAAIVVSLGGTMISLGKISGLRMMSVTGFAESELANVSVRITTQASINWTTNSTDFGSGYVVSGCTHCHMNTSTSGIGSEDATCCSAGLTGPDSYLVLENNGNQNVSLTFDFDKDAAAFIGGTNPVFQINISEGEPTSCVDVSGAPGSGLVATWNNTFANVPTATDSVCGIFQPEQGHDQLNVTVAISIPENAIKGSLSSVVTATATGI
ncbi:MAG: hypothetical protein KKE20_01725 [Nanoarchaeota archaeon]|nr:hypothetical protein [Nanoarchaeota archaeon]